MICGLVNPTGGRVTVDGHDILSDYRAARSIIRLVPQELTTDAWESVWATVSFSRAEEREDLAPADLEVDVRGLFGKPANPAHIEKVLKEAGLSTGWESSGPVEARWSGRT